MRCFKNQQPHRIPVSYTVYPSLLVPHPWDGLTPSAGLPDEPLPSEGLIGGRSIGCLCYLGARVSKSSLRQSETSQSQVQGYASEDLQQAQVCLFWRGLGKMEVRSLQRLENNQLVSKTSAT